MWSPSLTVTTAFLILLFLTEDRKRNLVAGRGRFKTLTDTTLTLYIFSMACLIDGLVALPSTTNTYWLWWDRSPAFSVIWGCLIRRLFIKQFSFGVICFANFYQKRQSERKNQQRRSVPLAAGGERICHKHSKKPAKK